MPDMVLPPVWGVIGAAVGAVSSVWTRKLVTSTATRALTSSPVGSALTAILFGVLAWRLGDRFELLPYSYLAAVGVPLGIIDSIEQRLPSALMVPSFAAIGTLFVAAAIATSSGSSLARAAAGMAVLGGFYLLLALVSAGGLGAGDVKLGALLGLTLGWVSWSAVVVGTLLGWLLGAGAWLALRAFRRAPQAVLPMGPFLLVGTFVTIGIFPPT